MTCNMSTIHKHAIYFANREPFSFLCLSYKNCIQVCRSSGLEIGQETAVSTKGNYNGHCVLPQILSQAKQTWEALDDRMETRVLRW